MPGISPASAGRPPSCGPEAGPPARPRALRRGTLGASPRLRALRVRTPPARVQKGALGVRVYLLVRKKWRRRRDSNPRTREHRINGFRDRRIQPLCHSSAWSETWRVKRRAMRGCWRRVRDLNPGDAFGAYTISNRAPSATRTTLREMHRQFYRKPRGAQAGISGRWENVATGSGAGETRVLLPARADGRSGFAPSPCLRSA